MRVTVQFLYDFDEQFQQDTFSWYFYLNDEDNGVSADCIVLPLEADLDKEEKKGSPEKPRL